MQLYGDYHTHTIFSHGKGTIEDNARAAAAAGLKQIAITDHGFSHIAFGLRHRRMQKMRRLVDEANRKYGVEVLLGVEANITGYDGQIDLSDEDFALFDIILCGFHKIVWGKTMGETLNFIIKNNFLDILHIKPGKKQFIKNTDAVINNIQRFPVDVLTHVNHSISVDCKAVAEACKAAGTYIEINGKRITYTDKQMQDMIDTGVMFIVNSDAHSVERIGDTSLATSIVRRMQIPADRIVNIGDSAPYLRSQGAFASKRIKL